MRLLARVLRRVPLESAIMLLIWGQVIAGAEANILFWRWRVCAHDYGQSACSAVLDKADWWMAWSPLGLLHVYPMVVPASGEPREIEL